MGQEIKEFRGVENLVVAEVTKDASDAITFGAVEKLAGVAEISKETENSSETHYYDNAPVIVINAQGKDTVTIQASVLPLPMVAKITGRKYDATKGMLIEGDRADKYFAIGYKTKATDGTYRFVWRLKGTFAIPNESHQTENEGTDANGQELVFTGIKTTHKFTTNDDKGAFGIVVDGEKTTDADFFAEVQTPDSFNPVSG